MTATETTPRPQYTDKALTMLRRAAIDKIDLLPEFALCPNAPACWGDLAARGNGPDPWLRCDACGWGGDVFRHVMRLSGLRFLEAAAWVEQRLQSLPVDGGAAFRWQRPDGSVHFDLPELTRRVLNAWPTGVVVDEEDNLPTAAGGEIFGRILFDGEWDAVCELLDLLPSLYQQRDQARGMAMEELALLRSGGPS